MKAWHLIKYGCAVVALVLAGLYLTKHSSTGKTHFPQRKIASQNPKLKTQEKKSLQKTSPPQKIETAVVLKDFNPQWPVTQTFENLKTIESCYNKNRGHCGFPMTDPKSEHFAIGQRIKKDLLRLHHQVSEKNTQSTMISELARHFMKTPDGHVKEASLHLLATQEKSHDNLMSILSDIIHYHDAKLIEQAMLELARYLDDEQQAQLIHQNLISAMTTGSAFVSQEIAKNLSPFINQSSFFIYSQSLNGLSKGSKTHQHLVNALGEYQRLKNAA